MCRSFQHLGVMLTKGKFASQWGAGHAVPDSGPESGPKIRSPKSGLAMGGASAFFMPRALNHVRLLHSIIDFISHGWATVC